MAITGLLLLTASLASLGDAAQNVLLLIADDMRPQAEPFDGTFGWEQQPVTTDGNAMQTPGLKKLASWGTTFTKAYCQFSICGPSRSSFMTSRRPDTLQAYDNNVYWRTQASTSSIRSLPEVLKDDHGFKTAGLGKIYHGDYDGDETYDSESWSYDFQYPGNASWWKSQYGKTLAVLSRDEAEVNGLTAPATGYSRAFMDRETTDSAIEYLKQFSASGDRFFLAVGMKLPHLPWHAPTEHFNKFVGDEPVTCRTPGNMPDNAFYDSSEIIGYDDVNATGYAPSTADMDTCLDSTMTKSLRQGYYASVSYVDSLIEEILDTLESEGLKSNTAVIFMSDHGYSLGEHNMWTKLSNFEIANRVPLIVYDPDSSGGRTTSAPVELVDIFPTVLDLADLSEVDVCSKDVTQSRANPTCTEGSSLVPLLSDATEGDWSRTHSFYQFKRRNSMGYSVVNDEYRYTMWVPIGITTLEVNWASRNNKYYELYDLVNDRYETTNIATGATSGTEGTLRDFVENGHKWYENMGDSADNQ